uniref:Uncharacterized protein n=1 Tax=Kalanchoe fedtschenkoi TaxID=63787 RepID=A0A7N0TCS8_KALFE
MYINASYYQPKHISEITRQQYDRPPAAMRRTLEINSSRWRWHQKTSLSNSFYRVNNLSEEFDDGLRLVIYSSKTCDQWQLVKGSKPAYN